MRAGQHSLGRLKKGFEANAEFQVVLKAGKSRPVDRQRLPPFAKRWVAIRPQVGNLSMSIKDAEDQLMNIFHRNGTELVKDAPHFDPVVSVRRRPAHARALDGRRGPTPLCLSTGVDG